MEAYDDQASNFSESYLRFTPFNPRLSHVTERSLFRIQGFLPSSLVDPDPCLGETAPLLGKVWRTSAVDRLSFPLPDELFTIPS